MVLIPLISHYSSCLWFTRVQVSKPISFFFVPTPQSLSRPAPGPEESQWLHARSSYWSCLRFPTFSHSLILMISCRSTDSLLIGANLTQVRAVVFPTDNLVLQHRVRRWRLYGLGKQCCLRDRKGPYLFNNFRNLRCPLSERGLLLSPFGHVKQ